MSPRTLIETGDIVGVDYRVTQMLRETAASAIALAEHRAERAAYLLKIVDAQGDDGESLLRFERQLQASRLLGSDHVVAVHAHGQLDERRRFLVMDRLEGVDLTHYARRDRPFSVEAAVGIALQILEALAEAHAVGIVHRDLQPAHVFLHGPSEAPAVKLLGFGSAQLPGLLDAALLGHKVRGDGGGPSVEQRAASSERAFRDPNFAAPETRTDPGSVDSRADIWSVGALLHYMLTGRGPLWDADPETAIGAADRGLFLPTRDRRASCPSGVSYVVGRCLEVEPSERFQDGSELAMALAPYGDEDADAAARRVASLLVGSGIRPREALSTIPFVPPEALVVRDEPPSESAPTNKDVFSRATRKLDKGVARRAVSSANASLTVAASTSPSSPPATDDLVETSGSLAAATEPEEQRDLGGRARRRTFRVAVVLLTIGLALFATYALAQALSEPDATQPAEVKP